MESTYWIDLDVQEKTANKILKSSPKTIYKNLATGNEIPKPTQEYLKEKTGSTLRGEELIKFVKDQNKELLKTVILLKDFSKKKNTEFILNFAKKKLGGQEFKKALKDSKYDRLLLTILIYYNNPQDVKELYWRYQIDRKLFNDYEISVRGIKFFEFIRRDKVEFQKYLNEFKKRRGKPCYCWEILDEGNKKVYCIRGFPSGVITPGVKRNKIIDRASTLIIKVAPTQIISIAAGSKKSSLKLCNYLLRRLMPTAKFERIIKSNDSSTINNIINSILENKLPDGAIINNIEVRNVSNIEDQPTIGITKHTGIGKSLGDLRRKGINLSYDASKVSKFEITISERVLKFEIVIKHGKSVVVCKNSFISEDLRTKIDSFFKELDLGITYGSEKI